MLPTLWIGNASSTPTELTIREGDQVLGRAADADLCVSESFVSTYHARLIWQKGQLKVLDLNSTNGTTVNGVPVVGWTTLTDGDVIQFGGIEAVVEMPSVIDLDDPSASFRPPPQRDGERTTDEVPRVPAEGADDTAPLDNPLPENGPASPAGRVAPVTLPPSLPTGITITDIEAVTDGYGDYNEQFGAGVFGTDAGHGDDEDHRRDDEPAGAGRPTDRRSAPAFNRDGVSPIVIVIAVALLVVIILAAVFFS